MGSATDFSVVLSSSSSSFSLAVVSYRDISDCTRVRSEVLSIAIIPNAMLVVHGQLVVGVVVVAEVHLLVLVLVILVVPFQLRMVELVVVAREESVLPTPTAGAITRHKSAVSDLDDHTASWCWWYYSVVNHQS